MQNVPTKTWLHSVRWHTTTWHLYWELLDYVLTANVELVSWYKVEISGGQEKFVINLQFYFVSSCMKVQSMPETVSIWAITMVCNNIL